jgi:hypothetical protein
MVLHRQALLNVVMCVLLSLIQASCDIPRQTALIAATATNDATAAGKLLSPRHFFYFCQRLQTVGLPEHGWLPFMVANEVNPAFCW